MKKEIPDAALCEALQLKPQISEHGKPLPPLEVPCELQATYIVTRRFTGISQQLCTDHARPYLQTGDGRHKTHLDPSWYTVAAIMESSAR